MITLKISNASELVSSKLGKVIESLTPDMIDDSIVEDLIMKKMIENLQAEGVKGDINIVEGMDIKEGDVMISQGLKIRSHKI